MGLWTLGGTLDGSSDAAVLVDSVTMRALPLVFRDAEEADAFLFWMTSTPAPVDPRSVPVESLAEDLEHFRTLVPCSCCETARVHKDIGRCDRCSDRAEAV